MIRNVVTRGFGNGIYSGSIPLVVLRGYLFRTPIFPTQEFYYLYGCEVLHKLYGCEVLQKLYGCEVLHKLYGCETEHPLFGHKSFQNLYSR